MTFLLEKKNPDLKQDEIEKILNRFSGQETAKSLEKAKEKHQSVQLAGLLGKKIELDIKSKVEAANKEKQEEKKMTSSIADELFGGRNEGTLHKRPNWEPEQQEEPVYFKKSLTMRG